MTAAPAVAARPEPPPLRRDRRRWGWAIVAVAALVWSLLGAGVGTGAVVNPGGAAQFQRFAVAAVAPAVDTAFLQVLGRATLVTVAYAALGSALALLLGALGAVVVSRVSWGRHRSWWLLSRSVLALPRGLHEAVWGLLLVNILGLDPWVGVLAIGIPYGAVTAKVFADLVDEVPRGAYRALRGGGTGALTAMFYGLLPPASGGLLSYSFYRLECAVRSAVVLGLIGAGGLGYQLALSFSSLRWPQVWTCIYALMVLCMLADVAGRAVRRRVAAPRQSGTRLRRDRLLTAAVAGSLALVAWSGWYLAIDPAALFSERARSQLRYVLQAGWPPSVDRQLLEGIGRTAVQTVQMSVIAIAVATSGAVTVAWLAARPETARSRVHRLGGAAVRFGLLLLRAIPPPVWALILLFVFLPGVLPGALALGLYTLGVLGRLAAEAYEGTDPRQRQALRSGGTRPFAGWLYGTAPQAAGPVLAFALYRWEVVMRDTILVGLLGAGGLGALLATEIATFDWSAVTTVLLAIIALTFVVDLVSDHARRALR